MKNSLFHGLSYLVPIEKPRKSIASERSGQGIALTDGLRIVEGLCSMRILYVG